VKFEIADRSRRGRAGLNHPLIVPVEGWAGEKLVATYVHLSKLRAERLARLVLVS
jgi:hypothetical protein